MNLFKIVSATNSLSQGTKQKNKNNKSYSCQKVRKEDNSEWGMNETRKEAYLCARANIRRQQQVHQHACMYLPPT